jgi:hypothetical protein
MPLTSSPASPPGRGGGSGLRLLLGMVLFLVALATGVFGFLRLIAVLDSGGYGTTRMRMALAILGAAGACLAGAIATLIWDIAKRYER